MTSRKDEPYYNPLKRPTGAGAHYLPIVGGVAAIAVLGLATYFLLKRRSATNGKNVTEGKGPDEE